MDAISSYRGRHTHKHTPPARPPQTGPITIPCAAKLSAQYKYWHFVKNAGKLLEAIQAVNGGRMATTVDGIDKGNNCL